jgi:putative glycosyltransferase (TIGR04348 family)
MRVRIIAGAPAGARTGNRITALRWARLLRQLGHAVTVEAGPYRGGAADLLIALHAGKGFPSIARFRELHPGAPIVVALTGTDLYRELSRSHEVRQSLAWATRIVTLHPGAPKALPRRLRRATRVIVQSAQAPRHRPRPREGRFEVVVVGHLRAIKDPLRAAMAARLVPATSRLLVAHIGGVLEPALLVRARAESARNPRYCYLGELAPARTLERIARARLLVITSRAEGGPNVLCEALAAGVPVLSTRIPGPVALLGARYPGLFAVADTRGLAALLWRAETDPVFYQRLKTWCARRRSRVDPGRERAAWRALLRELAPTTGGDRRAIRLAKSGSSS